MAWRAKILPAPLSASIPISFGLMLNINSRKRRRSSQNSTELEGGTCQAASKKRKFVYAEDLQQPATCRDNSTQTPLTRSALREHNRRSQAARVSSTNEQTRAYCRPQKSATSILRACGREQYRELKRLSKGGGPRLQDLRGVWIPLDFLLMILIS